GEGRGLVGTLRVIGLFTVLGWALLRVSLRTGDGLMRVTTMAVFMWIIGQAVVNVAVVVKLLPVIGVPLPYVSYGGSALVANLMAAGIEIGRASCRERVWVRGGSGTGDGRDGEHRDGRSERVM